MEDWEKFFEEQDQPFDVLVCFSQACIFMHMLIGKMRQKSEILPFRCACFFNGMHVRDKKYFNLIEGAPSPLPTIQIFGKDDEYYKYSRDGFGTAPKTQEQCYVNPIILEHEQSHQFPTDQPRANEIYAKVTDFIMKWCGPRKVQPMTALALTN